MNRKTKQFLRVMADLIATFDVDLHYTVHDGGIHFASTEDYNAFHTAMSANAPPAPKRFTAPAAADQPPSVRYALEDWLREHNAAADDRDRPATTQSGPTHA
ncbi:MAG: hypothetical protein ABIU96_04120 [Rhodanobacter sp.]